MPSAATQMNFSSVQSLSRVRFLATPWITARQASLSITNSQSSLKLTSIESVMPSSHLILCRPFSSCPQSLPASKSFPMSQLFPWGGQSIGVSALASVLPKNTHGWSPLEWTGWISLQSKGLSRVFIIIFILIMVTESISQYYRHPRRPNSLPGDSCEDMRHFFSEVQKCLVVFQSLSHVRLLATVDCQHDRLPCPSLSPRVCSNSCPLSQWCHPTISSSVTPFSSCPQSFWAPGSFPMSRLFAADDQNIVVSASTSVLPMNIQGWKCLGQKNVPCKCLLS